MKFDREIFVDIFKFPVEVLRVAILVDIVTQHENEFPRVVLMEGHHLSRNFPLVLAPCTTVANYRKLDCLAQKRNRTSKK